MEFLTTIKDPQGLHARPIAQIVQIATKFGSEIMMHSGEKSANLKSIINVMALGILQGAKIKIVAQGDDAHEAIEAIKSAMETNHLI